MMRLKTLRLTVGPLLLAALVMLAGGVVPVAADAVPKQRFDGAIVATGGAGGRHVQATMIVGSGVFTGVGRIVERDNLPGDPDSVSRDDLVFRTGRLHIVNKNLDFSFSIDPATCVFTATIRQYTTTAGGTGRFAHAVGAFAATVTARGIGARAPDGSCSQGIAPRFEMDIVSATGTLTL